MSDRELLELAARARGGLVYVDGIGWIHEDENGDRGAWWIPLDDDCAALQLAVDLEIDVQFRRVGGERVEAVPPGVGMSAEYCNGRTRREATRRAIVRAAAEIGGRMA